VQQGQHPWELQGVTHLLPRVQQHLGLLLATQQRCVGGYLAWSSEAVPRDRQPAVALLTALLRLSPYIRPEAWQGIRLLDALASCVRMRN
jgi:hypothetical protein